MNIKGFNKDLKCRGYQFEIGKTYDTGATDLELCTNTVFHYCKSLQQVHSFYNVDETNRFCEIEVVGAEVADDNKCGSNKIKILREITGEELDVLCGRVNGNTGLFNTGYMNTGDRNTGNMNTGDMNTGDRNTGDMNTGDRNTGDMNTGDFNSCNGSNGVFCTKEPDINIFNMPSGMTLKDFRNSKYWDVLWSVPFNLTEWVDDKLVKRTFKETCATWWSAMSDTNKEIIRSMPNFDADIFKEITGIEI